MALAGLQQPHRPTSATRHRHRDLPGRLAGAVFVNAALPQGSLALSVFVRGHTRVCFQLPALPGRGLPGEGTAQSRNSEPWHLGYEYFSPRSFIFDFVC